METRRFEEQARHLEEYVRHAVVNRTRLQVSGLGSKKFLRRQFKGELLDVTEYKGVESYYPDELVVTVRAGTPLGELEKILASKGQMLPFEPPQFQNSGTIGGAVAAGLAGPGSPWRGGARDSVLGIEMINGLGERLRFGGQVIKNVAGFDVSRLLTGANGALGVLLKISLKLIPIPEAQATVMMKFQSVGQLREMMSKAYPITATLISGDTLWLRLSGERSAVDWAIGKLGAQEISELGLWQKVRDLEHEFFKQPGQLWRLTLPVMTEIDERKNWLVERGAGLRWLKSDEPTQDIFEYAHHSGGAAIGFSKGVAGQASVQPEAYQLMLARVRQAFDPHGIFHNLNSEALLLPESGN